MSDDLIAELNARFGIAGRLAFARGPGGLPQAEIQSAHARATVALHGAQPLTYEPRGAPPVLWLSREAVYAQGKAIRGGIPVCWPWFGPHPADPAKPAHGFARTRSWHVLGSGEAPDGTVSVRLGLADDEQTRALWPHAFELELTLVVGERLVVELTARNTGAEPFTCTGALHSYFAVGDIGGVTIGGLDGTQYIDQVDGMRRKRQTGDVGIEGETDRIYQDTEATCTIRDPLLGRTIQIAKRGSRSTVVWNPWEEKARRLPDFGEDEYRAMVCVETANAAEHAVTIPAGGEHSTVVEIAVSPGLWHAPRA